MTGYEIASVVARSEVESRIEQYPVPTFLAQFLRQHWQVTLDPRLRLAPGEDSDAWNGAVTTLEDLVWSMQPKRSPRIAATWSRCCRRC